MMYDEDDDAPPIPVDWEDAGGWFNLGWKQEPPADAIPGETPAIYARRKPQ